MRQNKIWSFYHILNLTIIAFLLIAFTGTTPEAHAGNTRSFFMGDEAAMTGGAGIAVSRDSGSLWYNPAGLGGLKMGRMELSGTAYQATLYPISDCLRADLPSGLETRDVETSDIGAIPTSIVFVRNGTDDVSYGFGCFETKNQYMEIRTNMTVPYGINDAEWNSGLEFHQNSYVYHVGPAVGWQVSPTFRIGASLFFLYNSHRSSYQLFASIIHPEGSSEEDKFYSVGQHVYRGNISVMVQEGIQWEFNPKWHLALVFRSPVYTLMAWGDTSTLESGRMQSGAGVESVFNFETNEFSKWKFEKITPLEFQPVSYTHLRAHET